MAKLGRILTSLPARIVTLIVVVFNGFLLHGALTNNEFVGDCSTQAIAATGDCIQYISSTGVIVISSVIIVLGGVILAFWVAQRRWWRYVVLIASAAIAFAVYYFTNICTGECGGGGPGDIGGCPVVNNCHASALGQAIWVLPLAVIAYLVVRRLIVIGRK